MEEYLSLACLINKNKNVLCQTLENKSVPSESETIKELCINYVNGLTKKDAEYMQQLSLLEQDLISPVLKVINETYASDIELTRNISAELSQRSHKQVQKVPRTQKSSIKKELFAIAGGAAMATVVKPSAWGVILMGTVISTVIGRILSVLYLGKSNNEHIESIDSSKIEYKLTYEDAKYIVDALVTIGECIDKVLLTYRRHLDILQDDFKRKEDSSSLENRYIGILENYQDLLGNLSDDKDSSVAKNCIKRIQQTLQNQGFKIENYNEETSTMFIVREDDVDSIEQLTPAIIKILNGEERVILKGNVLIPKKV